MEKQKLPYLTPYREELGDCLVRNHCAAVYQIVRLLGGLLNHLQVLFQTVLLEP